MGVFSLWIAAKFRPWLRDSDDRVAEGASWLLFIWLFTLLAYDGLSGMPGLAWGIVLVTLSLAFICFTLYECYTDLRVSQTQDDAEIQKALQQFAKVMKAERERKEEEERKKEAALVQSSGQP